MVVACPHLLTLDLDSMKLSLYYFKTAIKRPFHELIKFPNYFTYSLEDRIKPCFQIISSRGITYSVAWLLVCSDQRFEEILDTNYIDIKETLPSFSMDGALELLDLTILAQSSLLRTHIVEEKPSTRTLIDTQDDREIDGEEKEAKKINLGRSAKSTNYFDRNYTVG